MLDERNVLQAVTEPEKFRADAGQPVALPGGGFELELLPYAVARLDLTRQVGTEY
jgi:hypothetical protein